MQNPPVPCTGGFLMGRGRAELAQRLYFPFLIFTLLKRPGYFIMVYAR